MIPITFSAQAGYGFTATLTSGTWSRLSLVPDPGFPAPLFHLNQLTPSVLEVQNAHIPFTIELQEVLGPPRLTVEIQNGGQPLTVSIPNEADVTIGAGALVTISLP